MHASLSSTHPTSRSPMLAASVAAILSLAGTGTLAAQQGVVTSGQGTIHNTAPGVTQIDQTSHQLGIDWQSFDIAAGERVQFNQPSANSVAINRILGQDPSQIHGSLSANGQVFLLNPNGIVFGATAQVNVGSLVASTLDLTTQEGRGRYGFVAGERAGSIINAGRITAAPGGSISLLGSSVLNQGWIVANYGTVNLGAGRAATLDFTGDGLVRFEVDGALLEDAPGAAVHNQGQIQADGGQVLLTARQARDVLSQAVNNEGVVRAARIDNRGGRIRLTGTGGRVEHSGVLDASSTQAGAGGEVQVLGDGVTLTGTALIDASGVTGGGSVLVGGSYRGADASVMNSESTQVGRGAVLRADATAQGNGGQVVVWSDGTTVFDGTIQARALGSSGDGGMAEVSGRQHLSMTGHAALQSAQGRAGTLLLDPGSITIMAGEDEAPAEDFDVIHDAWIQTQLAASSLHIQTDSSQNSDAEHLRVESGASIVWSTANTLTLQGDDSVTLLAGSHLQSTGEGSLVLLSSGAVGLQGAVEIGGDLTVEAGGDITQSAALDVAGTAAFTTDAGHSIVLGHAGNQFGTVTLGSSTSDALQNVTIHNQSALALGALNLSGDLIASTAGQLTQTDALVVGGIATLTAGAGQSVDLSNAANEFSGGVRVASAGEQRLQNVSVHGASGLQLNGLDIAGNLVASTDGALTQSAAVVVDGEASFTAGSGESIVLDHVANAISGPASFVSSGAQALQDVTVHSSTGLQLGATTLDGDLVASTGGAISQTDAVIVGGDAFLTAGGGESITLGTVGNEFSGSVVVTSADADALQDLRIHGASGLALAALTLDGNLTATTAGALTQSGALNVGGNVSLVAGEGQSLNFNAAGNDFQGVVSVASAGAQALQNVQVHSSSGLQLGALNIDGDLAATTGGSVTQSGAVVVRGAASFTAGEGESIVLNQAANAFSGRVTVASAGPAALQDVTLRSASSLQLNGGSMTGALSVSTTGGVTQIGALRVGGVASFTAGAGQSLILNHGGNDFSGAVSFAAADGSALQNVTVHSSAGLLLGAATLDGNLVASTGGSMTQSGALLVGGDAFLTAGGGESITMSHGDNAFTGSVSLASANANALQDATVQSVTDLTLAGATLAGTLNARTAGTLRQSGALVVGGDVAVSVGDGEAIILAHVGNDLSGGVSLTGAGAAAPDEATLHSQSGLQLGAVTLAGNLVVSTAGAVTQTDALVIGGDATFIAGSGESFVLDHAGNDFQGAVSLASSGLQAAQDVAIFSVSSLALAALELAGDLTAGTAGSLTQSGAWRVGGDAELRAGAGESITLRQAGNHLDGAISFHAAGAGVLQDVGIHTVTALDLGALSLAGNLHASTEGALTQSGALQVAGDAWFVAGGGQSITMVNAGNVLQGAVSFAATAGQLQDVSIHNSTNLDLAALTLSGNLQAHSDGSLTQSGDLLIAGSADFTAASGQSILLARAGNHFGGTVSFNATGAELLQHVSVHNTVTLDLGALAISGTLNAGSDASLTQSGALQIGGDATFTAAGGESILLSLAGNDFRGRVSFDAATGLLQNVSLSNASSLLLGGMQLSGNLLAQSAGTLTQSGGLQVAGDAIFRTFAGQSINLDDAGNAFAGAVSFSAIDAGRLHSVTLRNSLSTVLQALQLDGSLSVSTAGTLSQSGALGIAGDASFIAGSGESILLSQAGNLFGGSVTFGASGGGILQDVTVRSLSALALQALTLGGDLQVTAGGALTQSGNVTVAGAASFTTLDDAGSQIRLDATNSFGEVQAAVRNAADTADAGAAIVLHDTGDALLGQLSTASTGSITVQTTGSIIGRDGTEVRTGALSLSAGDDVGSAARALAVSLPGGVLDVAAGGDIHIQNASGAGTTVQVQRVVSGGDIQLTSDASLQVAQVLASGSVQLQTRGDVLRSGAMGQIEAGEGLSLQAGGSIGSADGSLRVQAASVSAQAQNGDVSLQHVQGDLRVSQVQAAGRVSLQAEDGAILANAPGEGRISANGDIELHARDGAGRLDDFDHRQGDALTIQALEGALGVTVTGSDADVYLHLADGMALSGGTFTGAENSRLLLESAGDLTFSGAGGSVSGFSAVGLSADGVLQLTGLQQAFSNGAPADLRLRGGVDVTGPGRELLVNAGSLSLASGGAGGNITLRAQIDRLDAHIEGGAGLVVRNAGVLTVGDIVAQGDVSVIAQQILSDTTTAGGIVAGNAVRLDAVQGIGANADERINTTAQSVAVHSDGSAFIDHRGAVQLSGRVSEVLDVVTSGDITVVDTLWAGQGLTLAAGQDATNGTPAVVGNILINGSLGSDGAAVLHAHGGAISDAADDGVHVTADRLVLTARQVGSQVNALGIDVATLAAQVDERLHIQAAGDLQLHGVHARQVDLNVAGRLDGTGDVLALTADQARLSAAEIGAADRALRMQVPVLDATATNGDIRIDQAGDLQLGRIQAGNDIVMTVDGTISQASGGRISAQHLQLAGMAVGGPDTAALQTDVASLTAGATAGGVYINEANDLQVRSVSAPGQTVVLVAGGALSDDGNTGTVINGAQVTLHAQAIGSETQHLQTAADQLTIRATDGGIYVAERDSVTLTAVRAEGAGQDVVVSTGNDGDMTVQRLVTQGGAVSLTAGGSGSLNVTGTLESNNGLVNLISGDVLAIPGLNTGAGTAVLHTVNDVTVGTIIGSSILIISDTGSVHLVSANAGSGDVTIEARNGIINDGSAISLTAGSATLTAHSIGSADNPLDVAVAQLSVEATAGGVFVTDTDGLSLGRIRAQGPVRIEVAGALSQTDSMISAAGDIALTARTITMSEQAWAAATGDITYLAQGGDIALSSLTSSGGRVLVIAANDVFSVLGTMPAATRLTGHAVEVRAGGLLGGIGRIGTLEAPLAIATHAAGGLVYLVVPAINGMQTATPHLTYSGPASNLLLKGYSGTSGALLFDVSTAFTAETVLMYGESIVPLRNGRVAVNSDSLSAAKQALSSGVIARVNIDWAAFDPEVSLFGTLDSALRLPSDQIDEVLP